MLEIGSKPYFVATDIAKALGYAKPNNAIQAHCRYTLKHSIPHPQSENKTLEVNVIPEGDIYRLITNSELPGAEKFEGWVFDDVLPAIRKHGMYATDELLDNPDLLIAAATKLK
ncbi:BRO family protein, partial [Clostridium beijerinckii]|nr:BRO family protein [Clostridium beijerinckii]